MREGRAPGGPNSFNFMQFLGNFGKIGASTSEKSWIRHCSVITYNISVRNDEFSRTWKITCKFNVLLKWKWWEFNEPRREWVFLRLSLWKKVQKRVWFSPRHQIPYLNERRQLDIFCRFFLPCFSQSRRQWQKSLNAECRHDIVCHKKHIVKKSTLKKNLLAN